MTGRERGYLLLTSQLGDPERRPLSVAQFRNLARRAREMERPIRDRDLLPEDFMAMGFGREMAERMLLLLDEKELLDYYLQRAQRDGCIPLTKVTERYPAMVSKLLGDDAPGCLWAKGNLELLSRPMISLVGSRDIMPRNLEFARELGRQAALQGFVLVSGNARGADRAAQSACLEAGGKVICVIADHLGRIASQENILYLSEDVYDGAFSIQRALSRNRVIHCLGSRVFVAQSGCQQGGTWDGTVRNLRQEWNPVYCFLDGSEATELLLQLGAEGVEIGDLNDIQSIYPRYFGLFDQ